jgi:hypothetical protein
MGAALNALMLISMCAMASLRRARRTGQSACGHLPWANGCTAFWSVSLACPRTWHVSACAMCLTKQGREPARGPFLIVSFPEQDAHANVDDYKIVHKAVFNSTGMLPLGCHKYFGQSCAECLMRHLIVHIYVLIRTCLVQAPTHSIVFC